MASLASLSSMVDGALRLPSKTTHNPAGDAWVVAVVKITGPRQANVYDVFDIGVNPHATVVVFRKRIFSKGQGWFDEHAWFCTCQERNCEHGRAVSRSLERD